MEQVLEVVLLGQRGILLSNVTLVILALLCHVFLEKTELYSWRGM